jgi:hypothetical protein
MICTSDLDGSGGIIAYHPAIVMDVSPYVGYQSGSHFRKRTKKAFLRVNKLSLKMLPIPISESCLPTTWWNCVFPENYDIQDDLKMIHMILARQTSRKQQ